MIVLLAEVNMNVLDIMPFLFFTQLSRIHCFFRAHAMVELFTAARKDMRILLQIERFSVRDFSRSQIILFIFAAYGWPQHFR
jgi:hypothetical protein